VQPSRAIADNIKESVVSSDCRHSNVVRDYSNGELICRDCGAVLGYVEEATYLQMASSAELEGNRFDVDNFIPDKYSLLDSRTNDIRKFYDSMSKELYLPKPVYDSAVHFATRILRELVNRRREVKLKTWEIAFVALAKACEMHSVPITRADLCVAFEDHVPNGKLKDGFKCFTRVVKALGEDVLPDPSAEKSVDRYMQKLRNRVFVKVLEKKFFFQDVRIEHILNEVEHRAKEIALHIKGVAPSTVGAVAISLAMDEVCRKYSVDPFSAEDLERYMDVRNLASKRQKALKVSEPWLK